MADANIILTSGALAVIGAALAKPLSKLWVWITKTGDSTVEAKNETIAVLTANNARLEDTIQRRDAQLDELRHTLSEERLRTAMGVLQSRNAPNLPNEFEEEMPTAVRRLVHGASRRPPAPAEPEARPRILPAQEAPYRPPQQSVRDRDRNR